MRFTATRVSGSAATLQVPALDQQSWVSALQADVHYRARPCRWLVAFCPKRSMPSCSRASRDGFASEALDPRLCATAERSLSGREGVPSFLFAPCLRRAEHEGYWIR